MKKFSLILIATLLCMPTLAQRRRKVVKEPEYTVTPQEAMAFYNFVLAEEILEHQIAELERKDLPTTQEEELLETARKSQIRLRATEQVTFVDSIVLPKAKVLEQINLSQECGKVMSYADFFKADSNIESTVFLNELGNHIVYAEANKNGHMRLKEKSLIGGEWSMEKLLTGFDEEENDNLNFPFLLSDGITMYYAAECGESIGGYDIFMTRYDADEQEFLAPENLGMPFNSPANDYLMVIDEFQQLGWLVTDRNQGPDTVCIYTFIPTETRRIYNEEEIGSERLASLAKINSIKDTWQNKEIVAAAQKRLADSRNTQKKDANKRDLTFVINDQRTAYLLSDFHNEQAKQKAKIWAEAQRDYESKKAELSNLRDKYSSMNEVQKAQIAAQIRLNESAIEKLAEEQLALEKEIRHLELGK